MDLERFVNLLIDANILAVLAAISVLFVEFCLLILGYRRSYTTRLRLLMLSLVFVAVLPAVIYMATQANIATAPHLSDILVSQYLKGRISLSAVEFDTLLSLRGSLLKQVHLGTNIYVISGLTLILCAIAMRFSYILWNVFKILSVIRNGITIRKSGSVEIVVSAKIAVPFTTRGLTKYYVVLPQSLLMDSKTLAISIGHEFQHLRQRDVSFEFLTALCSPFFVFNPGFWFLSQKLRQLREHACDIEYLRRSGCNPRSYAKALLEVAKHAAAGHRLNRIGSLSVPFIGRRRLFSNSPKSGLAQRILVFAAGERKAPNRALSFGLMVLACSAMFMGAFSVQTRAGWSHDRIMLSSVANLERLNLLNVSASPKQDN